MAEEKGTKPIKVVPMRYQEAVVTLRGVTRLVCHRFGESAQRQIEAKQQKEARAKNTKRDPQQEMEECLYVLESGDLGFPARAIKRCVVTAAKRFHDIDKVLVNGCLKIRSNDPTEYLPLRTSAEPRMRSDAVRLSGRDRALDMRYRPEFLEWEIDVPIRYNSTYLSQEQVINMFVSAGEMVGLGDGRVEKGMDWGEFQVVSFRQGASVVRVTGASGDENLSV
jgi:hypothetical protein